MKQEKLDPKVEAYRRMITPVNPWCCLVGHEGMTLQQKCEMFWKLAEETKILLDKMKTI